jgi:hypothetical protein
LIQMLLIVHSVEEYTFERPVRVISGLGRSLALMIGS